MKKISLFTVFVLVGVAVLAQAGKDLLLAGPMVGYTAMREAMLWVQTNGPAQVYFEYKAEGEPTVYRTSSFNSSPRDFYTVHLVAAQVKPGKTYTYQVVINGQKVDPGYPCTFKTPPLWQYRTDPPSMKIAMGSCVFINEPQYDRPGDGYGGEYEIFTSLAAEEPDMMLWLGDNTYLREADWGTRTGIIHRYTHTRREPFMQPLLASCANYAIWDDHDFGPNNSDYTFIGKETTLEAFKMFWGNPGYGLPGQSGTTSSFEWGDAEFFLLDNRYFRDPNDKIIGERSILGEAQRDWLVDALISSGATWKFVLIGGQVLNTVPKYENHINIAPEERTFILNAIAEQGIHNVIFLTGDRHHSELSMIEKNGVKIYDFTVSPLTSGPYDAEDERNIRRVDGSQFGKRNYGMIELKGERLSRVATLALKNVQGETVYSYEIKAAYPRRR